MKKLILMAFTATLANLAHSAYLGWSFSDVYQTDGSATVATGTYTAYLFVTASTSTSIAAVTYDTIISYLANSNLTSFKSASVYSATATASGMWLGATTLTKEGTDNDWGSGDSLSGFAVILDTSEKYYYVVTSDGNAIASTSWTSGTGTQQLYWGSQATSSTADGAWVAVGSTSVPEPTSGLLLLIGVAGLALKRKQA